MTHIETMKLTLEALASYMSATDNEEDVKAHDLMVKAFFELKKSIEQAKLVQRAEEAFERSEQAEQAQPCRYPNCDYPCMDLPECQDAEQAQPVGVVTYKEVTDTMNALWSGTLEQVQIAEEMKNKKLYTAPPPRQPWVGLTDAQVIRGGEAVSESLRKIGMAVSDEDLNATELEQEIAEYVFTQMQEAAHNIKENT